jgi:hypothetical protein
MVKHHTAFLNMFKQMMVGVFGPGMERCLVEYPLKHLLRRLEKPVLLNRLGMQVLNRHGKASQSNHLHKALGVNRSSRLYKAMEVAQFNNRTRIRQMGLHMEIWRSVHLDCHLTLLIR